MGKRRRTKKVGPTRGLGARYGVTVRKRYRSIVTEMRKPHTCPQCGSRSVRRESVGIWLCRKCGLKFAGGAYIPATKLGTTASRLARSAQSAKGFA